MLHLNVCVYVCVMDAGVNLFKGYVCWRLPWAVFALLQILAEANKPQFVFVWSSLESNCGSLSSGLQP